MKSNQLMKWAEGHQYLVLDLVRIYLGVALFIKGILFIMHRQELMQILERSGDSFIVPGFWAHYIIPAHLVGGALLALGLLTRFGAFLQLPILLGAVFYIYAPQIAAFGAIEERQALEFAALVLFLLVLIFVFGAGRLSLDYVLMRRTPVDFHPQPAT